MAIALKNLKFHLARLLPLLLLYGFSITTLDLNLTGYFSIVSFNLQLLIIFYWVLRNPEVLGFGHIFFAGILNDIITNFPLGSSALMYLVVAATANYFRAKAIRKYLMLDWLFLLIALVFAYVFVLFILAKFSSMEIIYDQFFYNGFFTLLLYPIIYILFKFYSNLAGIRDTDD